MWRSYLRVRLLILLASLGEAYVGQLARAMQLQPNRVRWLLHGRAPYYSVGESLVGLGYAAEARAGRGRVYRVTSSGLRKARSMSAAWLRAGQAHLRPRPGPPPFVVPPRLPPHPPLG